MDRSRRILLLPRVCLVTTSIRVPFRSAICSETGIQKARTGSEWNAERDKERGDRKRWRRWRCAGQSPAAAVVDRHARDRTVLQASPEHWSRALHGLSTVSDDHAGASRRGRRRRCDWSSRPVPHRLLQWRDDGPRGLGYFVDAQC